MEKQMYSFGARYLPCVRDLGYHTSAQPYLHPDRCTDYDVFLYVTKGSMQVIEENIEYTVNDNSYLFLQSGLHHYGTVKSMPGTSWYWIHFYPQPTPDLGITMNMLPKTGPFTREDYTSGLSLPKHCRLSSPLPCIPLLSDLVHTYSGEDNTHPTSISMQALAFFLEIHKYISKQQISDKSDILVDKIKSFLILHKEEAFDSSLLAAHLKLNYSYLSTLFKQKTGLCIIAFHTSVRMKQAAALLQNTEMMVSEISERLCFQNPYYFSRVFKKVFGESPSSFHRNLYK
ncbi:helix-turn-helix transcriptional regulator [Paenibacillus sp. Soil787]|uniref:helix-turn-helix transcriptional regulator n=1 Tax=Paenibacillus sp. Soil787 TaxID=1736411 RepID=UPI0007029061|nr:AraC family transcriptional regulator [Paenibacillus sp. Soil787]KRF19372.1 hypothetical protein ASG93_32425 [Paenibacillus sp. Soil787]